MIETFLFLWYIIGERISNIMKKNYYDILQVNKNASPEIIEKAYKVLAKKYHPDLQTEENKKQAEEILKEINEAYEILSDSEKKQNYDTSLLKEENDNTATTYSQEPRNYQHSSSESQQNQQNQAYQEQVSQEQERIYQEQLSLKQKLAYQKQLQQAKQKAYYDAYIQDLKNRGYKIRYKKSFKDYLRTFVAIILTVFVLFLIYQIPFVKNFFADLYEENEIFHLLVDIFVNFFKLD